MTETAPARRRPWRTWVAIVLVTVLAVVVIYQLRAPGPDDTTGPARPLPRDVAFGDPPPPVRLNALATERPGQSDASRNPFKFQPKAPPAPVRPVPVAPQPVSPGSGTTGAGGGPVAPSLPIPLKFIGTIDAPGMGTIAALSDGKFVYHGREGDVIEGRYRIVKIGVESIVMEHVDGRGRQTIRLTG